MRNLMVCLAALFFIAVLAAAPVRAQDAQGAPAAQDSADMPPAPAPLRSKSIVLRWQEERVQRHVGEPAFYQVAAAHELAVYVSGEGRVFSRLTNTTGAGTGKSEQVTRSGPAPQLVARVPEFGERTMTLFLPFQKGGMRRASMEFEPGFATCSARVIHAREEGATEILAWSPITRKFVEFQSARTFGETCIIRDGNVFAEP